MYLRSLGKKHYLFHSYRDGRGKVGQRQIYDLGNSSELAQWLHPDNWRSLQAEISRGFPELRPDWKRLRTKAEEAAKSAPSVTRSKDGRVRAVQKGAATRSKDERVRAVRKAAQNLLRLLAAEENDEVARLAGNDLAKLKDFIEPEAHPGELLAEGERLLAEGQLAEAEEVLEDARELTRHALPLRRRRVDPGDDYLKALDLLAETFKRQCRFREAEEVLAERVRRCPTTEARTAYGTILQFLKRPEEALEQFRHQPRKEASRYYNEAAALLDANRHLEALQPLLVAMVRDPSAASEMKKNRTKVSSWRSDYWKQHEEIWSEGALRFLVLVAEQPLVRFLMDAKWAPGVRSVLHPSLQKDLLRRIWGTWRNHGGKPKLKPRMRRAKSYWPTSWMDD